jgi:hypothetical protein
MAAVQAASFFSLIELRDSKFNMRWINISQTVILSGCWGFGALIFIWFFPVTNPIIIFVGIAGLAVFIWSLFHVFEQRLSRFLWMSLSTTLAINILMATWFYPQILSYQSSSVIGKWILDQRMEKETLFVTKVNARSIDVYTHSTALEIATFQIDSILQKKPQFLVFTNEEGLTEIKDAKISYSIVRQLEDYPVALLSMNFGNPGKRKDVLRKTYLIRVKKTI